MKHPYLVLTTKKFSHSQAFLCKIHYGDKTYRGYGTTPKDASDIAWINLRLHLSKRVEVS